MNIDRKVIEQALGALERPRNAQSWYQRSCDDAQAAKALREALAQPQPVQETVKGWWAHTCPEDGKVDVVNYQLTPADKRAGWVEHEVYTSPQAQPTQPLSDEQIDAIAGPGPDYFDRNAFARAIEQAHCITKGTT